MSRPSRVVVAGASAAGLSVAETLRREGFDGSITMIGDEDSAPYDRPPLSKEILSGKWPEQRVWLREESAIDALDLDLRLGVRATGADAAARNVELADGSTVPYDELVIATGVRPRRLPGTDDVPGVHVLRTLADARALRAELEAKPRLVIVGAGFLGAEVAAVARQVGADVTLVSDLQAPLSDVLGDDLGRLLVDTHREHGVEVITGVLVKEVLTSDGRVAGVRLADDRVIEADAVLVAIGSVPNTEWLGGSGIEVGDGVVCDEFCRAAPGVWAAGDVASWQHPTLGERLRIEHRTNAAEQGMAVARNILGEPKPFAPVPYIWSDQYDRKIQIYGLPRGADRFAVTDGGLADGRLVALYGRDEVVRAAVGINMVRPVRAARAHVASRTAWDAAVSQEGATA
ncbi:FAD-dependent oxidoreductase [Saccharopolyspora sp. K220]|uniref:NAD(P)/FAD-dependent oxidoreductase n=1 Tax=Saccharopolyspora soli TaxID=2926618 RepID=UPI001F59A9A8|nr:FAD-dependent oxidoreductase [Saccharopolyspora soli]MCI2421334.1 FAD-dependent oxidoreductase [Saccharopolyspora soli]